MLQSKTSARLLRVKLRRTQCEQMPSGLPVESGHSSIQSACLKRAQADIRHQLLGAPTADQHLDAHAQLAGQLEPRQTRSHFLAHNGPWGAVLNRLAAWNRHRLLSAPNNP